MQALPQLPNVDLWIKRDDLIHPVVSGNKWRKLAGFIQSLAPKTTVVTFGGAHSNHLAAAATCLQSSSHQGIFVVRGDELKAYSSDVLRHCYKAGMQLRFIDRSAYRRLREVAWQPSQQQILDWQLPETYTLLPEGGSGTYNRLGCQHLWQEIEAEGRPDHIWLAAGTGSTARGLLHAMPINSTTHITVVSAVKGAKQEAKETTAVAKHRGIPLTWIDETTFGGFAKSNPQLEQSRQAFQQATNIYLDPVYNAKVWWHLQHSQSLPSGRLVWIHTGGFRPPINTAA